MALGRNGREVMCLVVSSIELEVDFKLMLAAAAPTVQSMFASFLTVGQLMCIQAGRARRTPTSSRLDARRARSLQAGWTRAART